MSRHYGFVDQYFFYVYNCKVYDPADDCWTVWKAFYKDTVV